MDTPPSVHVRMEQIAAIHARALVLLQATHRGSVKLVIGRALAALQDATTTLTHCEPEQQESLSSVDALIETSDRQLDVIDNLLSTSGADAELPDV